MGADAAGEVGDLEAAALGVGAPPPAPRMVAVVTGPPLSGVSTQAARLAERYGVPVSTFDELLFEGADAEVQPATADAPPVEEPEG
eukprot:328296-Chlamydomonas_euryale.AAC.1